MCCYLSKKGKQYLRLQIDGQWWTSFARTYPQVGDVIEGATKPLGDGEVIDDLQILGGDEVALQGNPAPASAAPAANSRYETPEERAYKQLSIMCQSVFNAVAASTSQIDSISDYEGIAKQAFKTATFWDKKIKAYQGGMDVDAMKAGLNEDLSNQQSQNVGSPEAASSQDFDDDIPF